MTSIPQNVYIDKLNDIINECNNTCHRKVKIKPIDVKDNTLKLVRKPMIKILNFKLVIMIEYQKTKTFLLEDMLQIGLKKLL